MSFGHHLPKARLEIDVLKSEFSMYSMVSNKRPGGNAYLILEYNQSASTVQSNELRSCGSRKFNTYKHQKNVDLLPKYAQK